MRIMLLSQVPPTLQCTAGITLDGICRQISSHLICNAVLLNPSLSYLEKETSIDTKYLFLPKPRENGIPIPHQLNSISKYLKPVRDFSSWLIYKYQMRAFPNIIKKVVEFGISNKIDALVANLDTPGPILTALSVAKALNVPLYTMVFDPPEWHMSAYHMAPSSIRYVKKVFDETVANSKCCAVIAKPMADEFHRIYGVRTQVIQHSLPEEVLAPCRTSFVDNEHLYIGMAGQLYAREAWESLLNVLSSNNWVLGGRKVIIRYMGRGPLFPSNVPQHIEWLGWREQSDAIRILSECDILYCPYPFKPEERDVARLSFPSKITLYLAAARPILFHGPSYSSPIDFLKQTNTGLSCTNVNGKGIKELLENIAISPEDYSCMCNSAYNIFKTNFTSKAMCKNIHNFLGIGDD